MIVGGPQRGPGGGDQRSTGRPNGRAYHPPDYQDHPDLEPPYYVQDLAKNRSADDLKQLPEEYRQGGPTEPLYHQPPTNLEAQERCVELFTTRGGYVGENPTMPPQGNAMGAPYFPQVFSSPTELKKEQLASCISYENTGGLRLSHGSSRGFSPLRGLSLGSGSGWRGCSWRCTALMFAAVTVALAATTTLLAATQVGRWQSTDCLEAEVKTMPEEVINADLLIPPTQQPPPQPQNEGSAPRQNSRYRRAIAVAQSEHLLSDTTSGIPPQATSGGTHLLFKK